MDQGEIEYRAWLFVNYAWPRMKRSPTLDMGFEQSFREYLYSNLEFDVVSDLRDMGMGLSYSTLSDNPHELDVVCFKGKELSAFELKHYEVSGIGKEIVFTFLGKVTDFYLKNAEVLSDFRITMYLVTIKTEIDDAIRRLCAAYGIRLIEPGRKTLRVMDRLLRDLYEKLAEDDELKAEVTKLIESVDKILQLSDYAYSDIYRFKEGKVEIEMPPPVGPAFTVEKTWELNESFEALVGKWKSQTKS